MSDGVRSDTLYASNRFGLLAYDLTTHTLQRIGDSLGGTAFGYGNDGFWYVNDDFTGRDLYRINTFTLARVLIGEGAHRIEDIAASLDGRLFGVGEGLLFTINRATAAQTVVGELGFDAKGLAVDLSGRMLSVRDTTLVEIDPDTGNSVPLFRIPISSSLNTFGNMASEPGHAVATPCNGNNLLTNGSFETSDFTGWTEGGNFMDTFVVSGAFYRYSGAAPGGGAYYAVLGPVGSDGTLSQTFTTNPGQAYSVCFWLSAVGDNPSDFNAFWDGNQFLSLTDPTTGGTSVVGNGIWKQFVYGPFTGTGSDTLTFSFRDDPEYIALDNVQVSDPHASPRP